MNRLLYLRLLIFTLPIFQSCQQEKTLFTLLDAGDTGVDFVNFIDEDAENNVLEYGYFYNGGGVAAADFNNDGRVDLYFTGNMVANRMYLNQGNLKFIDISEQSGTNLNEGWKTGVSLVDINDDGWMDLYVCRSGAQDPGLRQNLLYVNNGPTADSIPVFTERAAEYGLADASYTTQAVFFDYDKDGDTDCFLLNHSVQDFAGFSQLLGSYRQQKNASYGNKLLRNDGGKYYDVTDSSGIVSNVLSFGLGINVTDFTNDGWPDLYIANDYNENDYLYINQKNGTFKEVIREATGHVSLYSMGTDAADINNDGWADILTLDMLPATHERVMLTAGDDNYDKYQQLIRAGFHHQTMRNMLQLNNGTNAEGIPVFSEIGQLAGVSNTDWSWAALFADFDNDGHKDIFVTNGYARDYTNMEFLKYSTDVQMEANSSGKAPSQLDVIEKMPPINQPNAIFKNDGNLHFISSAKAWGLDQPGQSNGAVYVDLDNDGDLDLVTNNVNEKAFIYKNNQEKEIANRYLSIQLQAPTFALKAGARVTLYQKGGSIQVQDFMPVRGFQSAMTGGLHFGLSMAVVDSVQVTWTDGHRQTIDKPTDSQTLSISYDPKAQVSAAPEPVPQLFQEKNTLDFTHQQNGQNDFRIQPLLPEMLSYVGPVLVKTDLNSDGVDDFYVGGGRGQAGALFIRKGESFVKQHIPEFEKDAPFNDADAVFFDADGDGDQDLLVVSAGYELAPTDTLLRPRLYLNQQNQWIRAAFPDIKINASCVAVSDVNGDNFPDLFIGERVTPGQFPESRGGVLLVTTGKGVFKENRTVLSSEAVKGNMVTKAVFSDIDGDKRSELLLASDWGTIQIWQQNKQGVFQDVSKLFGTETLSGRWTALAAADLDGDGDTDFVIGNTGTNWQWNVLSAQRLNLYTAQSEGGKTIPIVSLQTAEAEYPYASRDELLDQLPALKKKFPQYTSYANAAFSAIFDPETIRGMYRKTVNEFRSGILENSQGKLVFKPLPVQAQFAPIYACLIYDLNGDGKLDLLLGGNHSQSRVRMGRNNANTGQVFINQGNTSFTYTPQQVSGLYLTGDIRSMQAAPQGTSFEILIGQNGLPIKTLQIVKKR
ncbi:VCBS repeat-containing protein [Arundinibacter roseus]|uniref:ASPIC/UnbV domain-containing protein n=1 Tax=Arundinibacter roseus TaxID=2070510 RepID=A0A4V2X9U1_9BACT|nr:VCBS repeat-containing protein [Arundinibacter roseus]TDB65095.1 hypothetical protein EZE20_10280 [Arundinibacter roseus]